MKTTPTLGLKLYDGTDAPDLVSGYNASMTAIDGSGVLASQGTVQDSTDWDTIIDAGYYTCNNTKFSSENHSPVGSYNYGVLVVYNRCPTLEDIKCVTQIYYPHAGDAANRAPVSRAYYSNAWSAWAPLVDVPDVEGALPANGAAGQVLAKRSASDYDCVWSTPTEVPEGIVTASNEQVPYRDGVRLYQFRITDTASTGGLLLDGASRVVRAYTGTKSGGLEPTGLTIRAADYSTSYTLGTGRGEITNIGKINGRAPVGMSNYVTLSGSHAAGADYAKLVAAGIDVVKLGAGGIYLAAATVSLKGVATVNNIPATAGIARATTDNIEVTVNVVAPIPAQQTVVNVPIRFQVSKTAPTIVTVGKNDGDYTLLTCTVTPMSYPS